MFGFFCVSATVGAVIATSQVIAALAQAQDALPLNDVATVRTTDALQLQVPRRTFLTCLSDGFSNSRWWENLSKEKAVTVRQGAVTLGLLFVRRSRWRWTWALSAPLPSCCGGT